MIFASKPELENLGFRPIGGPIGGALFENDYYMAREKPTTLILRKIESSKYIPHRAKDINGKIYGEQDLYNFQEIEDEPVTNLLKILGSV